MITQAQADDIVWLRASLKKSAKTPERCSPLGIATSAPEEQLLEHVLSLPPVSRGIGMEKPGHTSDIGVGTGVNAAQQHCSLMTCPNMPRPERQIYLDTHRLKLKGSVSEDHDVMM